VLQPAIEASDGVIYQNADAKELQNGRGDFNNIYQDLINDRNKSIHAEHAPFL
jgi:hypothetical protein